MGQLQKASPPDVVEISSSRPWPVTDISTTSGEYNGWTSDNDTGTALGANPPDFESYCCLRSQMVSTFRSRAVWISLADCLSRLLQYFSYVTSWWIALEIRRWTFDSNRLVCHDTSDILTTSGVTDVLRAFITLYLAPSSTKFVSTPLDICPTFGMLQCRRSVVNK